MIQRKGKYSFSLSLFSTTSNWFTLECFSTGSIRGVSNIATVGGIILHETYDVLKICGKNRNQKTPFAKSITKGSYWPQLENRLHHLIFYSLMFDSQFHLQLQRSVNYCSWRKKMKHQRCLIMLDIPNTN